MSMKHTRPRRLRNRRHKQPDTRPLAEAARAGHTAAQFLRELAAVSLGVDAFLREKFLVGIATGPNELGMSEDAVMQIPVAFADPKIPLSLWVEQERMKLYRELTQGAHSTLQSLSSDLAAFEAYRSFYPSDIERKLALFEHGIQVKIMEGEVPDYVQR